MPTLFRFLKIGGALAVLVVAAMLALVYLVEPRRSIMTVPVELGRTQAQ